MRNEHARALRDFAANAGKAIAVDARPRVIAPKKGKGAYRRARACGRSRYED